MVDIGVVSGVIILKDQFSKTFGKLNTGMSGAKKAMVGVVAGAAAVTAALGLAVNKAFAFADALDNQAHATQVSAESLQVFNAAAEQSGLTERNVTNAIQRMGRNIVEGTKVAVDGLDRLNISLVQIRKLKIEDQFRLIIRELGGMASESEKTATAIALLGRAGAHFLGLTGDELDRFESELRDMNSIIDTETIRVVDLLEKEFDLLTRGIEATVIWIGAAAVRSTAFNTVVNLTKTAVGNLNAELSSEDGIQKWADEGVNLAIDNVRILALLVNEAVGVYKRWNLSFSTIAEQIAEIKAGGDPFNSVVLSEGLAKINAETVAFAETIQGTFTNAREKADEFIASQRTMSETSAELSAAVALATAKQARLNEMLQVFIQNTPGMSEVALDWEEVMSEVFESVTEGFGPVIVGVGDLTSATEAAFARMGIKTNSALSKMSAQAAEDFEVMAASGEISAERLALAFAEFNESKKTGDAEQFAFFSEGLTQSLDTGAQALKLFAGKNKAISIAEAIISGVLAIQRALAGPPGPPFSFAVAALTAGMVAANVAKISSTKFRAGTPGLDFQNFGAQSSAVLHGQEAVVPKGGGHQLAGEIASAMKGMRGGGSGGPIILELDGAVLARWIEKNTKSGRTRIHFSSVRDF